jgi:hypothetical protein
MAALPNTFASFKPPSSSSVSGHESDKAETSAIRLRPVPGGQPSLRAVRLFALAKEPEDARITGGTRSLDRRLLALNLATPRLAGVEG